MTTSEPPIRIFPLGDSALTVEFGTTIAVELNEKAIQLADLLEQHRFPGFIEAVPAFASTTVFFDIFEVRRRFSEHPTAFDAVSTVVLDLFDRSRSEPPADPRRITIPVDFSSSAALDLDELAEERGISRRSFISIFTEREYRVYMLGFLPGFAYMGEVDDRIASPRKASPRTEVPKGSVGIAGSQTGIYSLASPGGWQIIGRTDSALFLPDSEPPTLLRPGDLVTFESIG